MLLGQTASEGPKKRFQYLISNGFHCRPLTESAIEVSLDLLDRFTQRYSIKGNFRNSLNDMLIYGIAVVSHEELRTEDGLLARFAAERHGVAHYREDSDLILDFSQPCRPYRKARDNKGYVNRGWRIAVETARNL
jgi:hypothetical protein